MHLVTVLSALALPLMATAQGYEASVTSSAMSTTTCTSTQTMTKTVTLSRVSTVSVWNSTATYMPSATGGFTASSTGTVRPTITPVTASGADSLRALPIGVAGLAGIVVAALF